MNKNITALGLAILLATSAMMGSGCSKVEKKETKEYSILDEIIKEKESEESTATTSPYDERDTYVDDLREQYVEDEPVVRLSQEIKKTGEEAYKECPKAIDFFCEYMKVEKKDLELGYVFKTEEYNNLEICYEIKVSEDAEKSGKYIFAVGKGKEEVITMAKYVPDEVREEKDIEKWEEADLYEYLYDVEKIVEDTNEFVKPKVEVGNEYKYKEKLSDSNMIWGAYDGYVNEDDEFMVSYYEDFTHWNQGVYKDGYWKTKKLKSIKFGSAYECFTGKDDILWFYDEDLLDVRDKNKRVICQIKMNKWKKQNGIKKKATVEISPLPENKAIFTINGKESYRVNIRSGKIEMKYDTALEGEYYGDYICHYYGSFYDKFRLVNWRTGKVKYRLDLSEIRYDPKKIGKYVAYYVTQDEQYFGEIYNEDIEDVQKGRSSIDSCMYKNTLYFSTFGGVYRYNAKENKLERILNGEKYKYFPEMYSDFDIGKDEQIYMLGYHTAKDDESATDFLYLKKKD